MSVDINIKFSADERLLESMDLLSSWLVAVYAEMKKHPAAKVFPLIRKGSTQEEPQEPAPKPSAEPSADAPKEKPTVATPDAESKTEPPAESVKKAEKERRAEVKRIAGNAARNGKSDEVKELIERYGVHKLSDIPIDKLDAFAEEVSKL